MNWNSVIKYVVCKFSPHACSVSPADMTCEMEKYSEGRIPLLNLKFFKWTFLPVYQVKSGPQNLCKKISKPSLFVNSQMAEDLIEYSQQVYNLTVRRTPTNLTRFGQVLRRLYKNVIFLLCKIRKGLVRIFTGCIIADFNHTMV